MIFSLKNGVVFFFILLKSIILCAHEEIHILKLEDFSHENPTQNSYLQNVQGKIVHVRGFCYPISLQQGILASQINLKSCCVNVPSKIQQQIYVNFEGNLPKSETAVTLQGVFKIDPQYNSEGQLIRLFVLDDARIIEQTSSLAFGLMMILFSIIFFSIFYFFFRMKSN